MVDEKPKGKIIKEIEEVVAIHHFKLKDFLQVLVGASILSVPVGFTEETWRLGESLPFANIIGLCILSLIFISLFTYYKYHHGKPRTPEHTSEFIKRVAFTYISAFIIVSLILVLIERAPWSIDPILALKRTVIVSFPASLSAAIADTFE